jgi:hypothetical protein
VGCQPGEKAKIPVGIGVPKWALRPNPRWVPGLLPGSLAHGPFFLGLPSWAVWTSLPVEIRRTVSSGFGWASRPISLGRENIHVGRAGERRAGCLYRRYRSAPLPRPTGTGYIDAAPRWVPSSSPSPDSWSLRHHFPFSQRRWTQDHDSSPAAGERRRTLVPPIPGYRGALDWRSVWAQIRLFSCCWWVDLACCSWLVRIYLLPSAVLVLPIWIRLLQLLPSCY